MIINILHAADLGPGTSFKASVRWPGGRGLVKYSGASPSDVGAAVLIEQILPDPVFPVLTHNGDGQPSFTTLSIPTEAFPSLSEGVGVSAVFELPPCIIRFKVQVGAEFGAHFDELTLYKI